MARDPSIPLQRSVFMATSAVVDAPVLHEVPQGQSLPFIKIGDDLIEAEFGAGEFYACTVNVHVFDRTAPKVKMLAAKVMEALAIDLPVSGYMTCGSHYIQTIFSTEPDGMTKRATIEFIYLLQPV